MADGFEFKVSFSFQGEYDPLYATAAQGEGADNYVQKLTSPFIASIVAYDYDEIEDPVSNTTIRVPVKYYRTSADPVPVPERVVFSSNVKVSNCADIFNFSQSKSANTPTLVSGNHFDGFPAKVLNYVQNDLSGKVVSAPWFDKMINPKDISRFEANTDSFSMFGITAKAYEDNGVFKDQIVYTYFVGNDWEYHKGAFITKQTELDQKNVQFSKDREAALQTVINNTNQYIANKSSQLKSGV